MAFEVGSRVETEKNGKGRIAFMGSTQFSDGEWVGVILDEPKGKNNGSVQGVAYFTCEMNHGLFIRPSGLRLEMAATPRQSRQSLAPGALKAPVPASVRKDSSAAARSKLSPGSSPRMSPAVSMEKMSTSGSGPSSRKPSVATKADSPRNERKAATPPKTRPPPLATPPKKESPEKASPAPPAAPSPAEEPEQPPVNVMSRVKKMEESPMVPPSPVGTGGGLNVPEGMDQSTEMEYLRVEVKDLSEKLDTLRAKRKEDHGKLVEYERAKIQLQALAEHKAKMSDAYSDLQRQLHEAKKEAEELRQWREANQEDMSGNAELLEMATIDKEMAEEKAELLQAEVDQLREKCEELEADLEILKEEMAQGGGVTGVAPAGNSVQMKQLEQQNERLKEALIKLRDLNGAAVLEKTSSVREAELLRAENSELLRRAELATAAAAAAEERVKEYQEQVDASMGAEEMILALSTKNLDMEEQIRKLEQELEDLEALRDMDEQIQETQKAVEKDLLKDIEAGQVRMQELAAKMRAEETHSDELLQTIMKFRKRTSELNEEIQDLKDQVLRYESELSERLSSDSAQAGVASSLQVNAARAFAEAVELRAKSIELEFSQQHCKYLRAFLPDNFTKPGGDNDSVLLNVMFPRLANKARLLGELAAERFPLVPGGVRREHVTKSHKAEQWAHVSRVQHIGCALQAIATKFHSAVSQCSLEQLSRLSQMQPEMATHEKHVDAYVDLLRTGRFDENTSTEQLDKAVAYFTNVFSVHLSGDSFDVSSWLSLTLQQLLTGVAWWRANASRITHFVLPGEEGSDVIAMIEGAERQLAGCEQLLLRAKKRVTGEMDIKMTPEFVDSLQSALSTLDRLTHLLHDACGLAAVQIGVVDVEGFESSRVKEMLHGVVEKVHGTTSADKALQPIQKWLDQLRASCEGVSATIEAGAMEQPKQEKKTFPPMLERAHLRKQAAAEAEGLRWQLEKKDNEILELKKTIKARLDDLSNFKLRLEMADARFASSGKEESAKVQHLEAKIDQLVNDLKKKQIEFDETMNALEAELKASEQENLELRERAKNVSKKALLQGVQLQMESSAPSASAAASASVGSAAAVSAGHGHAAFLQHQLDQTNDQLARAYAELARIRDESLGPLSCVRVPVEVCGRAGLSAAAAAREHDPLDDMIKQAEQMHRDEIELSVFVSDPRKSAAANRAAREAFDRRRANFRASVAALRARAHRYWAEMRPGEPVPKLFGIEPASKFVPQSELNIHSKTFKDICGKWGIQI